MRKAFLDIVRVFGEREIGNKERRKEVNVVGRRDKEVMWNGGCFFWLKHTGEERDSED